MKATDYEKQANEYTEILLLIKKRYDNGKYNFLCNCYMDYMNNYISLDTMFDYDFMENFKDGYGIPLSEEQGKQGLKWLKKFINKNGESEVYGFREIEIIENASPSDFKFQGFYDNGSRYYKNYLPIYELNGMQYIPRIEPYIIG